MLKRHVFVYGLFVMNQERKKIFALLYKHKSYGMIVQALLIAVGLVSTLIYMIPNPIYRQKKRQNLQKIIRFINYHDI